MLNLTPHRRLHIPNHMAVIAAVLLIGCTFAGFDSPATEMVAISEVEVESVAQKIDDDIASIGESVKTKSHVLKLGLQLFQR